MIIEILLFPVALLVGVFMLVLALVAGGLVTFAIAWLLLWPCWALGWVMSRLLPRRFRYG
jgi:hypothetical protein